MKQGQRRKVAWSDMGDVWGEQRRLATLVSARKVVGETLELAIEFAVALKIQPDDGVQQYIALELGRVAKHVDDLESALLYSAPQSDNAALVTVRPAGGANSGQVWVSQLAGMYVGWAKASGMTAEIIESAVGEYGLRWATVRISGPHAFGLLRGEQGVHQAKMVERGKPLRKFAHVQVIPEIPMGQGYDLRPSDLEERTFRPSGPGGQHANVTDSAVHITHIPTALTAQCQSQRGQYLNRETALNVLRSRVAAHYNALQKERADSLGQNPMDALGRETAFRQYDGREVHDHRTGATVSPANEVLSGKGLGQLLIAQVRLSAVPLGGGVSLT